MSQTDMPQYAKGQMCKAMEPEQKQHLASKFCDTLGMSVILYREDSAADFRCLSSHLCGTSPCTAGTPSDRQNGHNPPAVIG